MRTRESLRAGVVLVLLVSSHTAAGVTLVDVSRQVVAFTVVADPPVFFDIDTVAQSSEEAGHFLEAAVSSIGLADVTNASAESLQNSSVSVDSSGVLRAEGSGSVGVAFDVFAPGAPARARGNADTTLSILFEIEEPSVFSVGVVVSADLFQVDVHSSTRPTLIDVHATALLVGAASGVVFERNVEDLLADDQVVSGEVSLFGTLAPDTYVLELFAFVDVEGFEDSVGLATAGFGYDLTIIPEPGSGALLALGLLALCARGRPLRRPKLS